MKLLHIINSLNTGGAEKLIIETLPQYEKLGLKVDLLVLVDHDYPFLKILKENFHGKIYILGNGSVYNPLIIGKLSKIMKNYDVIHVHLFPAQYFALIANKMNGNKSKLVFTEHCTSNRRIEHEIFKPIEKIIYNSYHKTVCITEEIQNIIKKHVGLNSDNLPIIHNGVNLSKIKSAKKIVPPEIDENLSYNDKLIIQVAAFRLQKDHSTAIKAMQYLSENFKLLLAGAGEELQNCENLVKKLNLTSRVFFLGNRNDVPQLLKSVDYVVLASHFEGLSLSSIEGMSSGKPFIASDVPGLREIVGGYGELFPDGDEKRLAEIILDLDSNPEKYEKVVSQCQNRAEDFDIKNMINQHIKLYEQFQG